MPFFYRSIILFIICILASTYLPAQDITGTWEGKLGINQFLQINIIQVNDKICGYTWDTVVQKKKSACKAYFTGSYNKKKKEWELKGTSFIIDSTGHVLMDITLKEKNKNGKAFLSGYEVSTDTVMVDILGNIIDEQILESLFNFGYKRKKVLYYYNDIDLKKISEIPISITDSMKDCFEAYLNAKAITYDTIRKKNDTPIVETPIIVNVVSDTVKLETALNQRKNKEQTHIVVNSKTISLALYDNALIDGDTVSVFFNDKLLVSHQLLSEKPINIELQLNEIDSLNKLVLFAENLGSIPPNTALIIVYAAGKRYELFASASLTENSVLVFEYRPPDK